MRFRLIYIYYIYSVIYGYFEGGTSANYDATPHLLWLELDRNVSSDDTLYLSMSSGTTITDDTTGNTVSIDNVFVVNEVLSS